MRCSILVLWTVVLLFGVPSVVKEANAILASKPPGPVRSQELRDLVVQALVIFVAAPFIALAIFGFGVIPRRGAAMTGGRSFDVLWRSRRRTRRQTKSTD